MSGPAARQGEESPLIRQGRGQLTRKSILALFQMKGDAPARSMARFSVKRHGKRKYTCPIP